MLENETKETQKTDLSPEFSVALLLMIFFFSQGGKGMTRLTLSLIGFPWYTLTLTLNDLTPRA